MTTNAGKDPCRCGDCFDRGTGPDRRSGSGASPRLRRMIGYRFHHDETAGDGEYILLSGEREVRGMRIPVERRWFTNEDDRYLGTDILVDDFAEPPGNQGAKSGARPPKRPDPACCLLAA